MSYKQDSELLVGQRIFDWRQACWGAGNGNSFVKGTHIGSAKTGVVTAFIPDVLGNAAPWTSGSTLSPEGCGSCRRFVVSP